MYKIDEIKMLRLGQRDENLARPLTFDCSDWLEQYPEASIHILFRRPGESAIVPISTTLEGTTLTWLIHDYEVGKTGIGNAEFRAVDTAGLRRKSRIIPCSIEETLLGDDETVLYTQDQVDETLAHISEAAQAAQAAKASEEAAALSASEAGESAVSAGTAADVAVSARDAAQAAQTAAETAQHQAEAAQSGVHADAEAAEQAKVAAQAAQAGAQGAASQASADRTAAESARADAEAAATHAEAVVEGIDQAGADQVAAVNAAGQAQVTAVNQAGTTQVGNVNAAGTTQVNAVQAKGTQVINSIPADYSTLSGDVTDLKSAIIATPDLTGEIITQHFIHGGTGIETSGNYYNCTDYIDISNSISGTNILCYCTFASNAGIAFYDTNKNFISGVSGNTAEASGYTTGTEKRAFVIPENAKYFRASLNVGYYTSASDFDISFANLPNVADTVDLSKVNRDNIAINTDDITDIAQGITPMGDYQRGSWDYYTSTQKFRISARIVKRVCLTAPYIAKHDEHYMIGQGFRVYVFKGVDEALTSYSSGQWYANEFNIDSGDRVLISIARVTEDDTETANVSEFVSKIMRDTMLSYSTKIINRTCPDNIKIVAHRGWTKNNIPENTFPSFVNAYYNGFKYVETDVQFTSDNVPILCHDYTIDRTSNGTGYIYNLTYNDIKAYDFNFNGDTEYTMYKGIKAPKFDEFIALCKWLGLNAYVELKYASGHAMSQAQMDILVDIVKKAKMERYITWISGDVSALNYITQQISGCRIGLLASSYNTTVVDWVSGRVANNDAFLDLAHTAITSEAVDYALSKSVPIEAWTPTTSAQVLGLSQYISGITVDNLYPPKIFADYYARYR